MRIVGRDKLSEFCVSHPPARKWIENWIAEVEQVSWSTPQDVKARYSTASFLASNTVIFNVKGNDYRLEVTVALKVGVVIVKWIGTHAAYDERNKKR